MNFNFFRFVFTDRGIKTRNGIAKWTRNNAIDTTFQLCSQIIIYQNVSSGISAYHWSSNCENAMYAQKMLKANINIPML